MTATPIGYISEIYRYPVKSFAGERLEHAKIESYGLYGDRSHAFIDETKEGWDQYVTARHIPSMIGYKTKFMGEGSQDEFPKVVITSPDGREWSWNEDLLEEIQAKWKKKISMRTHKPQSEELLAVDAASILIITTASLRKLEELWGKRLDMRRFRANMVVSIEEVGIDENHWIGKRLVVGDTELSVDSYCERCTMITIDPDSMEKDKTLLMKVNENMDLHFGVYASVIKIGQVNVGEKIYLVD